MIVDGSKVAVEYETVSYTGSIISLVSLVFLLPARGQSKDTLLEQTLCMSGGRTYSTKRQATAATPFLTKIEKHAQQSFVGAHKAHSLLLRAASTPI